MHNMSGAKTNPQHK